MAPFTGEPLSRVTWDIPKVRELCPAVWASRGRNHSYHEPCATAMNELSEYYFPLPEPFVPLILFSLRDLPHVHGVISFQREQ